MSNEEIFAMIGQWAKDRHPEKYEQTLRVAVAPETFRRYLLRLVEIWVNEDRSRMKEVPLSVLDETSLTVKVRWWDGSEKVIAGRRAEGPVLFRFAELGMDRERLEWLQRWKETLDLEYVRE